MNVKGRGGAAYSPVLYSTYGETVHTGVKKTWSYTFTLTSS